MLHPSVAKKCRLAPVLAAALAGAMLSAGAATLTNPVAETNATSTDPAGTNATPQKTAEPERDLIAARFLTTCAGCHSLAGAKLTGPELTPSTAWPSDQLKVAIKKMESKVGPLPEDVIASMTDFLKSPNVRERLKVEGERIAALFMAKMEPANPALGRELFLGKVPLKNGGLACVSCHVTEGQGGNLGLPLNGIFAKTGGEMPLISAIEQAKFKIMEPHYARHPVTRQEAMHLAKYFSTLNPLDTRVPGPAFAGIGAGFAAFAMLGMVIIMKKQRVSRARDTRLQRRRK